MTWPDRYKPRPPFPTGLATLLAAHAIFAVSYGNACADPRNPRYQAQPGPTPVGGQLAPPKAPHGSQRSAPSNAPPPVPVVRYSSDGYMRVSPNGDILATDNVVVKYADVTLTADRVQGNFDGEVVFSGHARIETRGAISEADAIHAFPRAHIYRLTNPRAVLQPIFLEDRVNSPVFLHGGELTGAANGYAIADDSILTTCIEPRPHYFLQAHDAELIPDKQLKLHNVSLYMFGVKLITLPLIVIPLDQREPRKDRPSYSPEFGQNSDEGYYARFPYAFTEGEWAATYLRLDFTQKKGEGYRVEQEYLAGKQVSQYNTGAIAGGQAGASAGAIGEAYGYGTSGRLPRLGTGLGPQNGGLLTMQGYFADGFTQNFNGSYRHQQDIGGSNRIGLSLERQSDSYFIGESESETTTHFDFAHNDAAHGSTADLSLNVSTNDSSGNASRDITGTLRQTLDFANTGSNRNSLTYNVLYSDLLNTSSAFSNHSSTINPDIQFQHTARDYSYSFEATKIFDLTAPTGFSGTLEKLPEFLLSADTANFRGGLLRELPLHIDFGLGRYTEPSQELSDERLLLGVEIPQISLIRGHTQLVTSGGFEQRLYSDGAAQYITRNTTQLRQLISGRSGFDITYHYEQPEGGTPFLFDAFGKTHNITAEAGYLDDYHFQATMQIGYDLTGTLPGITPRPFQTLSTRLMWRPNPRLRFDTVASYDPNTGDFVDLTNTIKLRAKNQMGVDLVGRYDPSIHKFSEVDAQWDIPLGHLWRITGIMRYNGVLQQFESRNFQLTRDWDCMSASLTYSDNPLSYRAGNDREIFLSIQIKAFGRKRWTPRGASGESIGTGIGDVY